MSDERPQSSELEEALLRLRLGTQSDADVEFMLVELKKIQAGS